MKEPEDHEAIGKEREALRAAWRLGGRAAVQSLARQLWVTLRPWCPECGGGGCARKDGHGENDKPLRPLVWCRTCFPWYPNDGYANGRPEARST